MTYINKDIWQVLEVLFPIIFRSLFYSSRGKHFNVCFEQNGVPTHVIDSIEKGQKWPEGDAALHRRILVPTLLVHGLQDTSVTLVQECEMERVSFEFLDHNKYFIYMNMNNNSNKIFQI